MLENRYSEEILKDYKAFYYYCRDRFSRPWITVCLLCKVKNGKPIIYARGVSICSEKDNICKKSGRELALERAALAIITQRDGEMIDSFNENIFHILYMIPDEIFCKSEYMPEDFTNYENKLLNKIKAKIN